MTSLLISTIGIDRNLLDIIASDAKVIVLDSTEKQKQITESLLSHTDITDLHIVVSERDRNYLETELERLANSSDRSEITSFLPQLRDGFLENSKISLHTFNLETKTFSLIKQLGIQELLGVAVDRPLDNNQLDDAIVTTDKDDYAPASTSVINGSDFQPGETIELQVLHTDGTPNTGGGHEPWQVTDGGVEDLDGVVDGNFETVWYVNPDDSANSAFEVTATGLSSGEVATNTFTDAVIFSENFDGTTTPTGWTLGIAGDTATTGQWAIGVPVPHSRFGTTANEQLAPYSGTKDLVTGTGNSSDVSISSGTANAVTTARSPSFTLSNSPNFNTLSFRYYLSTDDTTSVTGTDSFKVELVKALDNTVLSTLLNAVHAQTASNTTLLRTGNWGLASTSLDAYAGQNVYLRFTATDANNNSIVEAGVDDVNVTSVDKSIVYSASEKYSLGNRIWNDANNNGSLDTGETGINGVVVNLYQDTNNDGTPDGAVLATDTTISGGYYRFDNQFAGNYIVEVAASNFNTGGALAGLISSSIGEADPDSNVDKNDNGIGTASSPTNGIRSGTVSLGSSFIEPIGETELEPVSFTTVNISAVSAVPVTGTYPSVYVNAINGLNNGRRVQSATFFRALDVDVTNYGADFTGFCIEVTEPATPGSFNPVTATGPGPYYNSSYNDSGDISNFFGVDPNAGNYGIITQAELDLISTVWFNKNSTLRTTPNDAIAMQALIWELQCDQTFDLSSGNFYLDPNVGTTATTITNTNTTRTTVEGWVNNVNTGTWTGSLPLAILTIEDQQDLIVNLDLGTGSTDSQSNLTADFGFTDQIDYGDAPDTTAGTGAGDYQTTKANSGASHGIVTGLRIGSTVDKDSGTLQNTAADTDDTTNTGATDDEDGVTFSSTLLHTGDSSYSVNVNINNTLGSSAKLVGWIDFDQSGTFDTDEAVSTNVTSGGSSTQTLTWSSGTTSILSDNKGGTTYARFRLSTDSALTTSYSTGAAINGEVEDYQIDIVNKYGTTASDSLTGTSGNDVLAGYKGQDTLIGGGGNDKYLYSETSDSVDIITDFDSGDRIVLTQILKDEVGYSGSDPIGAGYVKVVNHTGVGTMIQIDFDASSSLIPKDLVFLQGVAANTINSSAFVF